jgi:prepilin signal peptidase PulO-like enzyme (type II secretory pathway)
MELFIITFFGILGVLIGSFLNVVILRFNTGKGIDGRSGCLSCGKKLGAFELVPIVSYLIQKGRCIGCQSKISKQYILVEALTGVMFALVAARILLPMYEVYSIISILNIFVTLSAISLLIVIFSYDLRHKIIPDIFSFGFALLALMRLALFYQTDLFSYPGFIDLLAGPLVALPFALVWLASKGQWMGLGDAKLAIGIGWFLGLVGAVSALCLAFWIGAVVSVGLLLIQKHMRKRKRLSMKSEVPFAPFLVVGLIIVYFFPMDILSLKEFMSMLL